MTIFDAVGAGVIGENLNIAMVSGCVGVALLGVPGIGSDEEYMMIADSVRL